MDPRITLGLISAAGAFLGAGVMIATAPDTGSVRAPTAPLPVTAPAGGSDLLDGAAPPAPVTQADDPFAGEGEEPDWGAPPPDDDPFGAPAIAPPPAMPPTTRGTQIPEGGPYPPDVRGVGQLFRDRAEQLDACMAKDGPAANEGELAVLLRVTMVPDGEGAKIDHLMAPQDKDARYTAFIACATDALSGAQITAPPGPRAVVHWSVRR